MGRELSLFIGTFNAAGDPKPVRSSSAYLKLLATIHPLLGNDGIRSAICTRQPSVQANLSFFRGHSGSISVGAGNIWSNNSRASFVVGNSCRSRWAKQSRRSKRP